MSARSQFVWLGSIFLIMLAIFIAGASSSPPHNRKLTDTAAGLTHRIRNTWPNGTSSDGQPKQVRQQSAKRHPLLFDWTTSCGDCEPEQCEEPPANCPSGLIRDACDCCYVCGNLEDTPCDMPEQAFRFGECGRGLECVPVPPNEVGSGESDSYCACADNTVICGSDDRTYSNPCQFRRASGRKRGLQKQHDGPCLVAPAVEIPPMNQTAEMGTTAVYSCSVSGYPLAWFEWLVNGESVFKPGISDDITIQIRSGPLKYQVTSWLEIGGVLPVHAGSYQCIAKNMYGAASASASLEVIPGENDLGNSYYVYRKRNYDFSAGENLRKENAAKPKSQDAAYLRSHTFYDGQGDESVVYQSQNSHSSDKNAIDPHLDIHDQVEPTENVDDVFVRALKDMIKPKGFKDIFFDDDDLTEGGSGREIL